MEENRICVGLMVKFTLVMLQHFCKYYYIVNFVCMYMHRRIFVFTQFSSTIYDSESCSSITPFTYSFGDGKGTSGRNRFLFLIKILPMAQLLNFKLINQLNDQLCAIMSWTSLVNFVVFVLALPLCGFDVLLYLYKQPVRTLSVLNCFLLTKTDLSHQITLTIFFFFLVVVNSTYLLHKRTNAPETYKIGKQSLCRKWKFRFVLNSDKLIDQSD